MNRPPPRPPRPPHPSRPHVDEREEEEVRLPDRQLLSETYKMVLSVYQSFPTIEGNVVQLFARLEILEKKLVEFFQRLETVEERIESRSDPRRAQPSYRPSNTGGNVIVEHPVTGEKHVAPSWTIDAFRMQIDRAEAAENWQGLTRWTKWTAKNVVLAILVAILLAGLSIKLGMQLKP